MYRRLKATMAETGVSGGNLSTAEAAQKKQSTLAAQTSRGADSAHSGASQQRAQQPLAAW